MGLDSSFAPRGQIFHTDNAMHIQEVKSLEAAASHLNAFSFDIGGGRCRYAVPVDSKML